MAPTRLLLVATCAALLASVLIGGSASAQGLSADPGAYVDDPLAQFMLAGEANAVADFLGISTDQFESELVGHSLAQVAQQHGKRVGDVTRVVVDTANAGLDTAVSEGKLPSGTAAEYRFGIALYAPMLVQSADASAFALAAGPR